MSFDYTSITATASRLLANFGTVAYVRSRAVLATDPAAGTVTHDDYVDISVNCLKTQFMEHNIPPGSLIENGDVLAILDGEIGIEDQLVIDGAVWDVINVFPIQPGDTGIIWKAQIRNTGAVADETYFVVNSGINVVNSGIQVVNTP